MRALFSCSKLVRRFSIILLIFTVLLSHSSTLYADISTDETAASNAGTTIFLPMMTGSNQQVSSSDQQLYLGIYINPGSSLEQYSRRIDQFETRVGKGHAIYHFYASWNAGNFTTAYKPLMDRIIERDATPMVSFMSIPAEPGNWLGCGDRRWDLDSILSGSHDAYLHQFAEDLAVYDHPVLMRWGHEMNLNQLSWAGACNDGRTDKFIQAYRHIVDIFREEGAHNAKWIWSPVIGNYPPEEWNDYRNYYPGDDYVDWIGVVGYNFGASSPYSGYQWATFDMLYSTMLRELAVEHPNKSVMLADYGCAEDDGGDKSEWIQDAFKSAKEHENLRAMVWFNYAEEGTEWPTTFHIETSEKSIAAYRQAISDSYFLDRIP